MRHIGNIHWDGARRDAPSCHRDPVRIAVRGECTCLDRSGRTQGDIEHTFTESMAKGGWANILEIDRGAKQSDLAGSTVVNGQTSNGLPTCADGEMWYKSPIHVLYWIRRGLKALNERGIEARHGLLVQSTSNW